MSRGRPANSSAGITVLPGSARGGHRPDSAV